MKFTLRLEQELPPVLRGLTFDGQKGLFVHRTEGKKVDLTLPVARVGDSIEEKIGQWKNLSLIHI